jgi:predicted mannosyl-3-phosphoglycerate phosphatase (HAD superfamily)
MLTTLADNKAAVREKLGARGHEDNEGQSHSHKVDEDDIEGLTGLNRERAGVKKDEQIGFYGNNVTFLETFIN